MRTLAALCHARSIVRQLGSRDARYLLGILTLPMGPKRHRELIIKSGLPLGALTVAQTFAELRRAA